MVKTLEDKMRELSVSRRDRINAHAAELIQEELTMRDLRNAHHKTQKEVAKKLGINQDNVSRLESRSDMLLSTLQGYVHALGGDLKLVATFPKRQPVAIAGFSTIVNANKLKVQRKRAATKKTGSNKTKETHLGRT